MSNSSIHENLEGRRRLGWTWKIAVGALIVMVGFVTIRGKGSAHRVGTRFTARRGPLEISVSERGSVEALESQDYRSHIRGWSGARILSIVDEGYVVTEEDVKNGKILIELDATDLRNQLIEKTSAFQELVSQLVEAQQAHKSQILDNESRIQSAQLAVKFAGMDLEKYLGQQAAEEVVGQLELPPDDAETEQGQMDVPGVAAEENKDGRSPESSGAAVSEEGGPRRGPRRGRALQESDGPEVGSSPGAEALSAQDNDGSAESPGRPGRDGGRGRRAWDEANADRPRDDSDRRSQDDEGDPDRVRQPDSERTADENPELDSPDIFAELHSELAATEIKTELPPIDFSKYAKRELLGDGEAQQRLRELEDDYVLAQEELTLAETQLEGTIRLAEQAFVTKNELEKDQMAVKRGTIKLAAAETAQNLFIKYEFPKMAEQLASNYVESRRELDRVRLEAEAQMIRVKGRLESRIAKYGIDKADLEDIQDQIDKCTIRAQHPGLVVYASSLDDFDPEEDRIKEGANIRRQRKIITIPDISKMGVRMKVHEVAVKKIIKGQKARIRVDAFSDRPLEGEVMQVSVLPDAKERAANPDVKVYPVSVLIEGYHEWLKPGMTAQVEVLVETLEDTVYVPIQAVVPRGGERVCYVVNGSESTPQVVETGEYNDAFIEIKSGLEEGVDVLLQAPEGTEPAEPWLEEEQLV